ncbi:DinB family protein [Variovorax sp. dw_954]|nr:DinB family protein [Variovorax sp. dw_954]
MVNHKTYHRGYVADLLYQVGLKLPVMDLPVYLRDGVQR